MQYKHRDVLQRLLKKEPDDYVRSTFGDPESNPIAGVLSIIFNKEHNSYIEQILMMNDDTIVGDEIKRYIRIAEELGFTPVQAYPFEGFDGEELTKEYVKIMWHEESGLLLKIDTFKTSLINRAMMYFNWNPTNCGQYDPEVLQEGHYWQKTWVGEHDVTEGLRYKLMLLLENGAFVNPWIKAPYISFKGYAEKTKVDEITAQRIEYLPKEVKEMIEKMATPFKVD